MYGNLHRAKVAANLLMVFRVSVSVINLQYHGIKNNDYIIMHNFLCCVT